MDSQSLGICATCGRISVSFCFITAPERVNCSFSFPCSGNSSGFFGYPQQTGKNDYSLCHPANVFVRETRLFRDNHLGMEGVAVSIMPGAYP
jgi:hypothetical protein